MSPVRIELGVHLLEVDLSGTGTAFVATVVCIGCIRLRCIGWQVATDDWRSDHSLSMIC